MALRIDLDERGFDLLIRFDYDRRLVEAVRQLPGRRFDPRAKLWTVPVKHLDVVVDALLPHGFTLAPEVSGLAKPGERRLPLPPPATAERTTMGSRTAPEASPTALTVSGLNHRVRDALRGAFPDSVWVIGEIVDLDKSTGRRHRFFALVDKAPGEARPLAQVEVALFESKIEELMYKLAAAQPPLALRDGLEIRVLGRVDLFPQSGRFQLIIEDIDPAHTLGKLALARDQLLRELRGKGLDAKNLALPLPRPTLRLAVLASPSSDGWHDFLRQLEMAGFAFSVTLYPVRVQGADLRRTMLAGLSHFAAHATEHDALCILRGGGSRSDLSGFDDRELAYAVANHPLKVLVGIGHERDRTVLDHIAQSFKTPTAIAAFLVDRVAQEMLALTARAQTLTAATRDLLAAHHLQLQGRGSALQALLAARLAGQQHDLALAAQRLQHAAQSVRLGRERHRIALARERLRHSARALVRDATAAADRARTRLHAATQRIFERARARLAAHDLRCRLLDPRTILRRGYAMVRRTSDGRIVTDAGAIAAPATLDVEFRDGVVRADVTTVTIRPTTQPS